MEYNQADEADIPTPSPNRTGGGRPWGEFAALLREHPDAWFEVSEHGMSAKAVQVAASRIRNGKLKAFEPAGHFEARFSGDRLWGRYTGPKEES